MTIKMKELDLDRLRDKLERLKNPSAGRNKRPLWKPTEEQESRIRLIQYPHGDDPFMELWFHYRVGIGEHSNFLCPKYNFNKECSVCDFARQLFDSGEETDKELAKQIFAKQRIYAVALDREDDTQTPKLWGFGKQVYQTLLGCFDDEEYMNFLDLYEGLDLKVQYMKPKKKNGYPKTTITFTRKDTALADTDEKIQQILDKIPKIEEVYQPITTSQVKAQLNSWMKLDEGDAEDLSSETTKGADFNPDDIEADEIGGQSVEDVDAAFEEALKDD